MLYTTDQIARRLNMSQRNVQAHIAHGNLRATRYGRIFLIAQGDLMEFIATRRKPGRPKSGSR